MCLAVPAKLISTDGVNGVADLEGNRLPISTLLVPNAAVGDWVLVHAGFAIQQLDGIEGQRTIDDLKALVTEEGAQ